VLEEGISWLGKVRPNRKTKKFIAQDERENFNFRIKYENNELMGLTKVIIGG
jgi:hypothetical protein